MVEPEFCLLELISYFVFEHKACCRGHSAFCMWPFITACWGFELCLGFDLPVCCGFTLTACWGFELTLCCGFVFPVWLSCVGLHLQSVLGLLCLSIVGLLLNLTISCGLNLLQIMCSSDLLTLHTQFSVLQIEYPLGGSHKWVVVFTSCW